MKIKFTLTKKQFHALFSMMTRLDTSLIPNIDTATMAYFILSGTVKRMFNRLDNIGEKTTLQWSSAEAAAFRMTINAQYELLDFYEQSIVDYMMLVIGMKLKN